jgi:hypothetical protein
VTAGVWVDGIRWYFTKGTGCVWGRYVPVLSSPTGEPIALMLFRRETALGLRLLILLGIHFKHGGAALSSGGM